MNRSISRCAQSLTLCSAALLCSCEPLKHAPDAGESDVGDQGRAEREDREDGGSNSRDPETNVDAGPPEADEDTGPPLGDPRREQDASAPEPTTALDLLFMIDNSGTMAEEQKKLSDLLDDLVRVLTTGNKNGQPSPPGQRTDFAPVESMHIGVVSSDMGVNGAPALLSCGDKSFVASDPNPQSSGMRVIRPFGDDGLLQTSTAVAQAGLWSQPRPGEQLVLVVPADPGCADVAFPAGRRFIDFTAGETNPEQTARAFGCIAKLGRNGCGLEQHLESMLKALTPPDSLVKFSTVNYNGQSSPNGHGDAMRPFGVSGPNAGFLREDAILAVVLVADEDDCSIPDSSRAMFDPTSTAIAGEVNVRCGLAENQRYLFSVERFVAGLKALKPPAYQDRIIVAGAVGMPVVENTGNKVHSGASAIDKILARPDMQFRVQRNAAGTSDEPVPTCVSVKGDGSAAPARRLLELIEGFGGNGVAASICEDEYRTLLNVVADKIVAQLPKQ